MDATEKPAGDPLERKLTYTLRQPVNVGGEVLTKVTVREATAGDLDGFTVGGEGVKLGAILDVLARCSGVPRPHLDKVKAGDAIAMVNLFGPFLGLGAETGESG